MTGAKPSLHALIKRKANGKFSCAAVDSIQFTTVCSGGSKRCAGDTWRGRDGHHGSRIRQRRAVTTDAPGIGGAAVRGATVLGVVGRNLVSDDGL
ncbi:hypothetical protein EVAR_57025_1 [Eumeta japonica]|uniref:Uncharacterized protein n=1 Tax=Eumeta variegata TaxID=151549 RepID=A0A4C2AEW4_EUMVA|nr:hypothetical protein EVAR_57025_1 [Eumeta japonica]